MRAALTFVFWICVLGRWSVCLRGSVLLVPVVCLALCGVSHGQEDVPALIHKLTDKNKRVRQSAAAALGEIGPAAKAVVPALIAALKDEDERVRSALRTRQRDVRLHVTS